jgi:hypothetical protein
LKYTATVWRNTSKRITSPYGSLSITCFPLMRISKASRARAENLLRGRAALAARKNLALEVIPEESCEELESESSQNLPGCCQHITSSDEPDECAPPNPTDPSYLFNWPEYEDPEEDDDEPDLDDTTPDDAEEGAHTRNDAGLEQYISWFSKAQESLMSMDDKRQALKRKHTYTGNSKTSKWRCVKTKEKMKAGGFLGVREFMERKVSGLIFGTEMQDSPQLPVQRVRDDTAGSPGEALETFEGEEMGPADVVPVTAALRREDKSEHAARFALDAELVLTMNEHTLETTVSMDEVGPSMADASGPSNEAEDPPDEASVAIPVIDTLEELTPDAHRQALERLIQQAQRLGTVHNRTSEELARLERQLHTSSPTTLLHAKLCLRAHLQNTRLDLVFRNRLAAMYATLNLYLDKKLGLGWHEASILAARGQGYEGEKRARSVRTWIHDFIQLDRLPQHGYRGNPDSLLLDEDLSTGLKLFLMNKRKAGDYIRGSDVVDYVATPEVQEKHGTIKITEQTGRRWLGRMGWRFKKIPKGMYIDGHEREDVVAYRIAFVDRWFRLYKPRMVQYDNDGNVVGTLDGRAVPLPPEQEGRYELILVTHDESTFYAQDRRPDRWIAPGEKPQAQKKGEGPSLMVSDFYTLKWGPLRDDDGE